MSSPSAESLSSIKKWGIPEHATQNAEQTLLERLVWVRYRSIWWPAILYHSYGEMQQQLYGEVDMIIKAQLALAIMRQMQSKRPVKVARLLGRSALEVVELEETGQYCEFYWSLSEKLQGNCDVSRYEGDIDLFIDFHQALDQVEDIFREVSDDSAFALKVRAQEDSWIDEALEFLESTDGAFRPHPRTNNTSTKPIESQLEVSPVSEDLYLQSFPVKHSNHPKSGATTNAAPSQRPRESLYAKPDRIPDVIVATGDTPSSNNGSRHFSRQTATGSPSNASRPSASSSKAVAHKKASAMESFLKTLHEKSEHDNVASLSRRPSSISGQALHHFTGSASTSASRTAGMKLQRKHTIMSDLSSDTEASGANSRHSEKPRSRPELSRTSNLSYPVEIAGQISSQSSTPSNKNSNRSSDRKLSSRGHFALSFRPSSGRINSQQRIERREDVPAKIKSPVKSDVPPALNETASPDSESYRKMKSRGSGIRIPPLTPEQIPTGSKKTRAKGRAKKNASSTSFRSTKNIDRTPKSEANKKGDPEGRIAACE